MLINVERHTHTHIHVNALSLKCAATFYTLFYAVQLRWSRERAKKAGPTLCYQSYFVLLIVCIPRSFFFVCANERIFFVSSCKGISHLLLTTKTAAVNTSNFFSAYVCCHSYYIFNQCKIHFLSSLRRRERKARKLLSEGDRSEVGREGKIS